MASFFILQSIISLVKEVKISITYKFYNENTAQIIKKLSLKSIKTIKKVANYSMNIKSIENRCFAIKLLYEYLEIYLRLNPKVLPVALELF